MRAQPVRANSICDGPSDLPAGLPSACVNLHLSLRKRGPCDLDVLASPRSLDSIRRSSYPLKGLYPRGRGNIEGSRRPTSTSGLRVGEKVQ